MDDIADEIRRRRVRKSFSQSKLASLVDSSQVEISRIERGVASVNYDLLEKLTYYLDLKLRQPIGYPLLNQTSGDFINQVENVLANYRYDELNRLLRRPENQDLMQKPFMQKIRLRLEGLVKYHCLNSFASAATDFTKALSLPVFSEFDKYFDAETYNAYANCLAGIGQTKHAKIFYRRCLAIIDTIRPRERGNIRIRALLNLSKLMRKERDIVLAQHYLDEAIAINEIRKSHYMMSYLYYQQAMIANDCQDLKLCRLGLQNSLLFAHACRFKEMNEYGLAMDCVIKMNQQEIWEYNGTRLSECSNAQIFHVYGQL